jgi:hypothetical protein
MATSPTTAPMSSSQVLRITVGGGSDLVLLETSTGLSTNTQDTAAARWT